MFESEFDSIDITASNHDAGRLAG